jgi:hypothetical protein
MFELSITNDDNLATCSHFLRSCFAQHRSKVVPSRIFAIISGYLNKIINTPPPMNATEEYDPSKTKRLRRELKKFKPSDVPSNRETINGISIKESVCIEEFFRYATTEKLEISIIELPPEDPHYLFTAEFLIGGQLIHEEREKLDTLFSETLTEFSTVRANPNIPEQLITDLETDFRKLYHEQTGVHRKTLVLQMVKRTHAFLAEQNPQKRENIKAVLLHDASLFKTSFVGLNVFGAIIALVGAFCIGASIGVGLLSAGTAIIPAAGLGLLGGAFMASGIGFFNAKRSFQKPVENFTQKAEVRLVV